MHKIFFAGIDGSGKSSCLDFLVSRLQTKFSIFKLDSSDPSLFFKGERKLLVNYKLYRTKQKLRRISIKYQFQAKYIELFNKTDITIYSTDILLHPAVYVTYHFRFSRKIISKFRFMIARCLFGLENNLTIFYLDTEPEVAMNRILMRGAAIHPHENTRDLGRLKEEFVNMIEIALKHGVEIFRINTNDKNVEEVTDEVQKILEKTLTVLKL